MPDPLVKGSMLDWSALQLLPLDTDCDNQHIHAYMYTFKNIVVETITVLQIDNLFNFIDKTHLADVSIGHGYSNPPQGEWKDELILSRSSCLFGVELLFSCVQQLRNC